MTITDTTQAILLHLLDQLPGDEAEILRDELTSTHKTYIAPLTALQDTGCRYELASVKIRSKASLQQGQSSLRLQEEN